MASEKMKCQAKVVASCGVVEAALDRLTTAGDRGFKLTSGAMDFGHGGVIDGHVGASASALPIRSAAWS